MQLALPSKVFYPKSKANVRNTRSVDCVHFRLTTLGMKKLLTRPGILRAGFGFAGAVFEQADQSLDVFVVFGGFDD